MVYDGTKSGLSDALWVPWFPLPTIDTHLRAVLPDTLMADLNISKVFLNFILHKDVQRYAGVDLTSLFSNSLGSSRVLWEHWGQCGMGFKSSPLNAIQGILYAEEIIKGSHLDPKNVFCFYCVWLNLLGQPNYAPSLPWVAKYHVSDGNIADDLFTYVDDYRTMGCSKEECWQVA